MDTGTIIGIIGTTIGVIALLISILGLFYTRKRIKIMEKETERKRTLEEASKFVRQAIGIIKDNTKPEDFRFLPLDLSTHDILAYMHDNQIQTLKLHIKPRRVQVFSSNETVVNIRTVEDLIRILKDRAKTNELVTSYLSFDCKPDILQNTLIGLGDEFDMIRNLYGAHGILESYDYVIDVFDSTILDELKQNIDCIVEAIFKSSMAKHEITFSSTDKSDEILRKLQNEIVDRKSVLILLGFIKAEICDQRLSAIQKEMFLKS